MQSQDQEKWQKAIQGISTAQNDLLPDEQSSFAALVELSNNGNFTASKSGACIRVLKDRFKQHAKNRLLSAHLKNFIALCEKYFTPAPTAGTPVSDNHEPIRTQPLPNSQAEIPAFEPPTYTQPVVPEPAIEQSIPQFTPPIVPKPPIEQQTPQFAAPTQPEVVMPSQHASATVVPQAASNNNNEAKKGSSKGLIRFFAVLIVLISCWYAYKNWDTLHAKFFADEVQPHEELITQSLAGLWDGTINNEAATLEILGTVGTKLVAKMHLPNNITDSLNGDISGLVITLSNVNSKTFHNGIYAGTLKSDSTLFSGLLYLASSGEELPFAFSNPLKLQKNIIIEK